MADTLQSLQIELSPAQIEVEPGATPVEATVTLQNLGNVVEQYTADVVGLDPEWFTAPVASVALFPQDRDQLRITFHPPKRTGIKAGTYPFKVVIRARSGAQEESVDGVLDVRGFAVYRLDLVPRRQTARTGKFKLQVVNTGTADVNLVLDGRDQDDGCEFKLANNDAPRVRAGATVDLPVVVRPKKRPWVGPDQTYDFTLSARPQDARGDAQTVTGQFTYHPFMRSWALLRRIGLIFGILFLLLLLFEILAAMGIIGGAAEEFPRRTAIAAAQVKGFVCRAPGIDRLCGPTTAPQPAANVEHCSFQFGFLEAAQTAPDLVGACTTDAAYDSFGNGVQYTNFGTLWWLKASNTVYLFRNDSVYLFFDNRVRLLDGSGR
jgi:hypothetical protein